MIEMRWVHRNNANDFYCGYFEDSAGYPRVLQYRCQLHPRLIADETGKNWSLKTQWSDWIDVPTVTEG